MPIYEYKCSSCGHVFEMFQSLGADGSDLTCPECNAPAPQKLFSAFASGGTLFGGSQSSSGGSSAGCSSGFG